MIAEYYSDNLFDIEFCDVDENSITNRFKRFHRGNPDVYFSLVKLARDMRMRNSNRKIGMKMLFEVLRWNHFLNTTTDEEYKLSNDFTAPYARLIMLKEKDLAGAFNLRPSEVDVEALA